MRPTALCALVAAFCVFACALMIQQAGAQGPPAGQAPPANPNGVQLSPDEKTLYATNGQTIMAFDVQPDGSVRNGRVFAKSGGDGLATDTQGRLYSAVGGVQGIRVFSPDGKDLGTIPVGVAPQSVGFAGPGKRTLYIVGRGALYKTQSEMLSQGIQTRAK